MKTESGLYCSLMSAAKVDRAKTSDTTHLDPCYYTHFLAVLEHHFHFNSCVFPFLFPPARWKLRLSAQCKTAVKMKTNKTVATLVMLMPQQPVAFLANSIFALHVFGSVANESHSIAATVHSRQKTAIDHH